MTKKKSAQPVTPPAELLTDIDQVLAAAPKVALAEPEVIPPVMRVETTNGSPVEVRVGYQIKPLGDALELDGEPVTKKNFTHAKAVRIRHEQPHWFRNNILRGYYALDSDYWK